MRFPDFIQPLNANIRKKNELCKQLEKKMRVFFEKFFTETHVTQHDQASRAATALY